MNVDGLKTGHTDIGGYGLTASALPRWTSSRPRLNGMQICKRAPTSQPCVDWGYRGMGFLPVVKANDKLLMSKYGWPGSNGFAVVSKDWP